MRTFFVFNVGESTSMYANRPRSCRRNDLDVCESTCMRNDRLPSVLPGHSLGSPAKVSGRPSNQQKIQNQVTRVP